MKIDITPNIDQIRFYATSALHAFDSVDLESGRHFVIADMRALLAYLDACDNGVGLAVFGIAKVEDGVRLEVSRCRGDVFEIGHVYATERTVAGEPCQSENSAGPLIERVGRKEGDHAPTAETDLSPVADSGGQQ